MKKRTLVITVLLLLTLVASFFGYEYYAEWQSKEKDEMHLRAGYAFFIDWASVDLTSKNLDRRLAAAILNRHYIFEPDTVHLKKLSLKPEKIEAAIQDGIIEQSEKFPRPWILGPKANQLTKFIPLVEELPPNLMGKPTTVQFKESQAVDVRSIDGISQAAHGGGFKVDYSIRLRLEHDAETIFSNYFYITVKRTALLRLYDDGWRVIYAKATNE